MVKMFVLGPGVVGTAFHAIKEAQTGEKRALPGLSMLYLGENKYVWTTISDKKQP